MTIRSLMEGGTSYIVVMFLIGLAFFTGRATVTSEPRVAVAEKGAVVMEAVLSRPQATPEIIEREVRAPVMRVLSRYADAGYMVIDVSKDEQGLMAVSAVPANTVEISGELRAAVGLPKLEPKPAASKASAPDTRLSGQREF